MIVLPWSNIWHPVWPTISSHFHPIFGQRSERNVLWESCPKRSNFCLIVWQNIYYYVVRSDMSEFNEFASPDRPNFLWNWQNYNLLMRQEDRRWSRWYNETTPQRLQSSAESQTLQHWALQGWTQKGRRCTGMECLERQCSERHLLSLVDMIGTVNCIFSPYNCSAGPGKY